MSIVVVTAGITAGLRTQRDVDRVAGDFLMALDDVIFGLYVLQQRRGRRLAHHVCGRGVRIGGLGGGRRHDPWLRRDHPEGEAAVFELERELELAHVIIKYKINSTRLTALNNGFHRLRSACAKEKSISCEKSKQNKRRTAFVYFVMPLICQNMSRRTALFVALVFFFLTLSVSQAMPSGITGSTTSPSDAASMASSATGDAAPETHDQFLSAAVAVSSVKMEDRGHSIQLVGLRNQAEDVQTRRNRETRLEASEPMKQRLVKLQGDKIIAETGYIAAKTETIKGLWGKSPLVVKLLGGSGLGFVVKKGFEWASSSVWATSVPDRSATAWAFVNEPVPLCKARCAATRCTDPAQSRVALVPAFVPSELKAVSKLVCASAVVDEIKSDYGLAQCIMTWVRNQIDATHSSNGGYEL
jgi:hypothetical protein